MFANYKNNMLALGYGSFDSLVTGWLLFGADEERTGENDDKL